MSAATATAAAATRSVPWPLCARPAKQLKAEPQALIFDCDGTLLDTMPWWPGWVTTCAKYGLRFSKRRFYAMAGTPVHVIFKTLAEEQHVDIDIDEVMRFKKSQSRGKVARPDCPRRGHRTEATVAAFRLRWRAAAHAMPFGSTWKKRASCISLAPLSRAKMCSTRSRTRRSIWKPRDGWAFLRRAAERLRTPTSEWSPFAGQEWMQWMCG